MAWYQLFPESFDHFTLKIYSCFPRAVVEDEGAAETIELVNGYLRAVHQQDIAACEATWAGLGARSYEVGRLAPLEKPLWQFNQWWIDAMRKG